MATETNIAPREDRAADPPLVLFLTMRRSLHDVVDRLRLEAEAGEDSFDEFSEAHGSVSWRDRDVPVCFFSYRPDYKSSVSVAAPKDSSSKIVVFEFLREEFGLGEDDFILTEPDGYTPDWTIGPFEALPKAMTADDTTKHPAKPRGSEGEFEA